jgi:CBS-domain-containing membrane protein
MTNTKHDEAGRPRHSAAASDDEGAGVLELTDEDVLDAMRQIQGYLDISTDDFRAVYRLAHARALQRLFALIRADRLMLGEIEPLRPAMHLDAAAGMLMRRGLKSLPVVDDDGGVAGILTETDFLRCLGVGSWLELISRLGDTDSGIGRRCRERSVAEIMTAPAVTVPFDAGAETIMSAFKRHPGRSMPVTDAHGRLCGLLLRKDFLHAYHPEQPA